MKLNPLYIFNLLVKPYSKWLPPVLILTVTVVALRDILFAPGLVLFGDQVTPLTVERYLTHFYPMWNSYGSIPVFNASALWVTGSTIHIASFFHLSIEAYVKLFFLGIVFLIGISMYYAAYILVKDAVEDTSVAFFAAIVAALVYMLNPWVMPHVVHVITVGYALMPLILVSFIKALQTRKIIYIIITAILWSIASTTPHVLVFNGLLVLSLTVFSVGMRFRASGCKAIYEDIGTFSFVLVCYLAFNAFWLLPHVISNMLAPGSSVVYLLTDEGLDFISRNSTLINVIRFMGFWEPESNEFYQPAVTSLYVPWLIGSFSVPVFAFASWLLVPNIKRAFKYIVYFSLMSLLLIFLAKGTNDPFPGVYHWLILDVPFFSDNFGWLFREPDKWVSMLALTFSFLVAFTVASIFQWCSKHQASMKMKLIPLVVVVLFVTFFSIFAASADRPYLGDYFIPTEVPQDFDDANKWLEEQEGDYKVALLPYYVGRRTAWGYRLPSRYFYNWSSSKTSLMGDSTFNSPLEYYYYYIYDENLLKGKTDHFGKYLAPLNTRYVLVHDDLTDNFKEEVRNAIANLKHQEDMTLATQRGFFHIFENEGYSPYIYALPQVLVVIGGLDTLDRFGDDRILDMNSIGLLYLDQATENGDINADGIIMGVRNNKNDIVLASINDKYIIAPMRYTNTLDPGVTWAKASLLYWHFMINGRNLSPESWDWDYGKGFVSSYDFRKGASPEAIQIIGTDKPKPWQTIHNSQSENITVDSDGESLIVDYTFKDEKALSVYALTNFETSNWEQYDTGTLWVYGDGSGNWIDFWYRQTNWDESTNVHGTGGRPLDWTGWEEVTLTLPNVQRDNVNQLMISISWDIKKSQAGLGDHKIQIKDITMSSENPVASHELAIPVEIEREGPHRLFARVFENVLGGEISISLDGQEIGSLHTKAKESNFVWKEITAFDLSEGSHTLTIENIYGFNAVNILALMPQEVAEGYFANAQQFLKENRLIQIWEGKYVPPPGSIEVSDAAAWQVWHNTENESIETGVEEDSLVIDYAFKNENALSIYARKGLEPQNWQSYDTLSLKVYGDGSGNNLNFWYNTRKLEETAQYGMGAVNLDWTGWKEVSFSLPNQPRENVMGFFAALSWDINKSERGLGAHTIKVEDIEIKVKDIETFLKPPDAREKLYILKDSYYKVGGIALTGPDYGAVEAKIGNVKTKISLNNTTEEIKWVFSEPIYLEEGEYSLEFLSKGLGELSNIVIFSVNNGDETLENIFQESEPAARVTSFREDNATKHVAQITAEAPFMLAFAESYNKEWVATVKGKEYKSQPLYGVINGFWIEETGELEIIIEYKLQRWFNRGAIISAFSLALALGLVVWEWRRKKGKGLEG